LALSVPLSRFTSQVGGGSAFYVRPHYALYDYDTYVSDGWRRLVGGDSISHRYFLRHGFCFPVTLEHDDAAGF